MINYRFQPQKPKKKKDPPSFVRYTNQVANNVLRGIKMSSAELYDKNIHPLKVLSILKEIGVACLAWKPEVLFAHIDRNFGGVSAEKAAENLDKFHETGEIQTLLPELTKQKIYALRIIMTSDSAHREWNVFEKVGSVLNGRLAHFGIVEPMSPEECSKAVACIDAVRPDEFSDEIKSYIAASCHLSGIYTLEPSKYLKMADEQLQMMNREETGRPVNDKIISDIKAKLPTMLSNDKPVDDFAGIQAAKLISIDYSADEFIKKV